MANPVGRPQKYSSPEELQELVDHYFDTEKFQTLAGLALALGMARSTLYEYDNKDQFSDIIKAARAKVMALYESLLIHRDQNPTGVIFALKNMGWKDRSDVTTNDKDLPAPLLGGQAKDSV